MVTSHDHGPVAALLLVVWSENGMRAFSTFGQAGICGCAGRGAQAPLPKVAGWWAAGDLGLPPSGFGLAAPIGSTVHDLLLQSGEEAWWRHLLVLHVPPVEKIADWH